MITAHKILTSSEKFIIKLGLERVKKVLEFLGNPQDGLRVIHVAGTNGKGSVCAILSSILCAAGLKTGHFSSPHLFSYCERFKINENEIGEKSLDALVNFVCECAQRCEVELTEFEIITVAAFYYFAKEKTDIVVLETGLGGRLDATNVVKNPLAAVITSISKDHTQRLGDTVNKIAFEKAGIIKSNCPVIVSQDNAGYQIVKKRAEELDAEIISPANAIVKDGFAFLDNKKHAFALLGSHQGENLALAYAAAKLLGISQEAVAKGLVSVKHRFRMEYQAEKKLLIDGCHNPDGARVLRNFLDENFANLPKKFIFGCLYNKECGQILKTLISENDEICLYEFNNKNALKFEELPDIYKEKASQTTDPKSEIDGQTLTVVCGSLYMLGEIFYPG